LKQDREGLVGAAEIYKQVAKEGKLREMLQVETGDDLEGA